VPTITVDPLPQEALSGLKDPTALLRAFNRLQEECAVLNGRLTQANLSRLVLAEKELVTPSEWVALTPLNSFAEFGPTTYGALAVRKDGSGRVEIRERVQRTAGPPALFTPITNVGPAYAPALGVRRVADAGGAHGAYDVLPNGDVRWLAGDPTSEFSFCGGSWAANDRSIPTWEKPFRVILPTTLSVSIREVLVVARAATFDGYGIPVECTVYKPTVERVQGQEQPVLSIPRIDGLQPEQRYKLTLWAYTD
jgi:hypothetical protein